MFKFFGRKKDKDSDTKPESKDSGIKHDAKPTQNANPDTFEVFEDKELQAEVATAPPKKQSFFQRLKQSLTKTRTQFTSSLANLFLGKKVIDDELLEEIETLLLRADVGIEATESLIEDITKGISRKEISDPQAVFASLKGGLLTLLKPCEKPLNLDTDHKKPYVILMVGVNGSGKTTTIGKLAKYFQLQGKKVMLAAGDTFRAAAVEQLQIWGERNNVPVIAQQTGADSASVIFDAFAAASARDIDVLIADTAGRLHTRENLMEELKKIIRVLKKRDPCAPHEVQLIIDAGIGQNALLQAQKFQEDVGVSGITLTKLDGTAKGGIIFAIAKKLKLPIRFLGCGEKIDDLRQFSAEEFIEALFAVEEKLEE